MQHVMIMLSECSVVISPHLVYNYDADDDDDASDRESVFLPVLSDSTWRAIWSHWSKTADTNDLYNILCFSIRYHNMALLNLILSENLNLIMDRKSNTIMKTEIWARVLVSGSLPVIRLFDHLKKPTSFGDFKFTYALFGKRGSGLSKCVVSQSIKSMDLKLVECVYDHAQRMTDHYSTKTCLKFLSKYVPGIVMQSLKVTPNQFVSYILDVIRFLIEKDTDFVIRPQHRKFVGQLMKSPILTKLDQSEYDHFVTTLVGYFKCKV
jgi:hypothetical protein